MATPAQPASVRIAAAIQFLNLTEETPQHVVMEVRETLYQRFVLVCMSSGIGPEPRVWEPARGEYLPCYAAMTALAAEFEALDFQRFHYQFSAASPIDGAPLVSAAQLSHQRTAPLLAWDRNALFG
ncbi:hypothetical protein E4T66_17320 [Sinimarinibacterium sp. CAU 1509]|uniref:hypothetical protein n=1 Tax=Sinimarinibacterium sp. CAU 1509 TaxID=2562283 RepID=UPI0010ABFD1A|nr:hypothetical protein [Sinimarinibacterium sp. CAU 1509]TJY57171.1 hypothetical protein E4T66_17320 [Sinimarinibacterium sp. CAU 1509]